MRIEEEEEKMNPVIEIKLLRQDAKMPEYATDGSAAMDLRADFSPTVSSWVSDMELHKEILPGQNQLIMTGISISIADKNIVGVLASRSGHGLKHRVRLSNGIGIIDSDYHEEVGVILHNDSDQPFIVNHGDRIAQLMFVPVIRPQLMAVSEFSVQSERSGFGSTGVK
jgi:dUTP pyrophosphatase